MKEEIFKRFQPAIKIPERDVFLLLRSEDLLNEFDDEKMVKFYNFKSNFELKRFFEFEKHPKMRLCDYNKINVEELFFKRHHMLVYISPQEENF